MSLKDALKIGAERKLDIVEVAPMARPVVCRLMDYKRMQYLEQKVAKKRARSNAPKKLKTVRLSARIGDHDFDIKLRKIVKFLTDRHPVNIQMLRTQFDLAFPIMERLISEIGGIASLQSSKQAGPSFNASFAPSPKADGDESLRMLKREFVQYCKRLLEEDDMAAATGRKPMTKQERERLEARQRMEIELPTNFRTLDKKLNLTSPGRVGVGADTPASTMFNDADDEYAAEAGDGTTTDPALATFNDKAKARLRQVYNEKKRKLKAELEREKTDAERREKLKQVARDAMQGDSVNEDEAAERAMRVLRDGKKAEAEKNAQNAVQAAKRTAKRRSRRR
jgi:translation initiation factor IF-3